VQFFYFSKFLNGFKIAMVQRFPSGKFSNKIWNYRELNKEQVSSLKLFKIQNEI
jgi:hypothetical protein